MTNLKDFVEKEEFKGTVDKFPQGDTYLELDKTEVEKKVSPFKDKQGNEKFEYKIKYNQRDYTVGELIMKQIKEQVKTGKNKIRITRTGTTKDDTRYTVLAVD
jgi:hypothetical protein